MKKLHKILPLLFLTGLILSLSACTGKTTSEQAPSQRSLAIIWPTLSIDFYSTMADVMKTQAEEAGWKVEVMSFDFDPSTQASQLENCQTTGVTDIITCTPNPDPVEDVCIRLRQQGINISMFALAPGNPDAYDTVTVADQYKIGAAIAENASQWVNETFPDADDGSVDAVIIEVPADDENVRRAQGMEQVLAENSKINIVRICKLDGEEPEKAKNAIDEMMSEYPDTKVVLCHFSSLAQAADDTAMSYSRIDREHFGIFSGDWDDRLAARIQASANNESLIRGTGTYATDAMEIQFHVCTGEYNRLLNDRKQYVYPVVRITSKNINSYLD